ncbi:hypothetical protein INT48_009601 [Thamnidium elegans]|uniref:C2H2-type domain-containing protein n=1 Tax=Thamnidium elegans TaxID=101142 RepID=A0A8H7SLS0_9FUNG|nr:hypothetical protein INT48_009601 [Thamnidium elegans]
MDIAELIHMDQTDKTLKRHACKWPECHKSFSRPFQCTELYCGKRFIQQFISETSVYIHIYIYIYSIVLLDINIHLCRRIHTGNRPYKCYECNKSYTKKTILVRHARMCHDTSSLQLQHGYYNNLPSPPASQYGDSNNKLLPTQYYEDPSSPTSISSS